MEATAAVLQLALFDPLPDPCTRQTANQGPWGQGAPAGASRDQGSCVEKVVLIHGLGLSGADFQSEVTVSLLV